MELAIKNDDHLIKMASVVQRALNNKTNGGDELLSDDDKEMLFASLAEMNTPQPEIKALPESEKIDNV
jgi:hypothetical protein